MADRKLLRMPEVEAATGFQRSTIYLFIRTSQFPKPIKLGRASAWLAAEVDAWIEQQAAARDAQGRAA